MSQRLQAFLNFLAHGFVKHCVDIGYFPVLFCPLFQCMYQEISASVTIELIWELKGIFPPPCRFLQVRQVLERRFQVLRAFLAEDIAGFVEVFFSKSLMLSSFFSRPIFLSFCSLNEVKAVRTSVNGDKPEQEGKNDGNGDNQEEKLDKGDINKEKKKTYGKDGTKHYNPADLFSHGSPPYFGTTCFCHVLESFRAEEYPDTDRHDNQDEPGQ